MIEFANVPAEGFLFAAIQTSIGWVRRLALLFAAAAGVAEATAAVVEPANEGDLIDVQTDKGPVRGTSTEGIRIFRGIPFAKPPVGPLRFKAPEPLEAWTDPKEATRFGHPAPQNTDPLDQIWGDILAPGDEDCLTLNIWTPRIDDRRRPVMVAIHGGAFIIGSGREVWCEGTTLATRGDVVVVTVNYRLGALGFLDLSEVGGPEYAESANSGLLDQIAALRWVQKNIARFGGDPDNVTVFGCSAGGISISCLMAMSAAEGLFHKAIPMSGGPSLVRSPNTSRLVTKAFLEIAGVKDIEGLRSLSTSAILKVQRQFLRNNEFGGDSVFGPVVDGRTIPRLPLDAIRDGSARNVALLTGTTHDEARFWSLYEPVLRWARPRAMRRVLELAVGEGWSEVIETYQRANRSETPGNVAMAIQGDILFRMPAIRLAEAQAVHRPSDTRMYLFSWRTPAYAGRLGSPHAIDVPFVYGNLNASGVQGFTGSGADRAIVSRAVQDAWLAFAHSGDPTHPGLPAWPPYDTTSRPTMVFDAKSTLQHDPMSEERKVWRDVPFDGVLPSFEKSLPTTGEIFRAFLPPFP